MPFTYDLVLQPINDWLPTFQFGLPPIDLTGEPTITHHIELAYDIGTNLSCAAFRRSYEVPLSQAGHNVNVSCYMDNPILLPGERFNISEYTSDWTGVIVHTEYEVVSSNSQTATPPSSPSSSSSGSLSVTVQVDPYRATPEEYSAVMQIFGVVLACLCVVWGVKKILSVLRNPSEN